MRLWNLRAAALFLAMGLCLATGCKKDDGDEDDETEEQDEGGGGAPVGSGGDTGTDEPSEIPQVGSISLSGLGVGDDTSASLLQDDESECQQGDLGVFGLALGGACHTAPFASRILLGKDDGDFNGDGTTNCADFVAGENKEDGPGLLLMLMCLDLFTENDGIQSFSFNETTGEDKGAKAISFADFDNDNEAVGSWTRGNAASYPADIRMWGSRDGGGFDTMEGIFAFALKSLNEGNVQVSLTEAETGEAGGNFAVNVDFKNATDTSSCAENPSKDTCHFQEIKIYAGEGEISDGPPNGFHLKILADDKDDASFYSLEGSYRYTETNATAQFASDPTMNAEMKAELAKVRSVYFQAIQKGGQIWGRFEFRDENDALLSLDIVPGGQGPSIDIFAFLAREEGVCQNLGSSEPTDCKDVDYTAYMDLWNKDAMDSLTSSPVDADFTTGKPTKQEICTVAQGCIEFGGDQEEE